MAEEQKKKKGRKSQFSQKFADEFLSLRRQGYRNREIAKKLDVAEVTIYSYLAKNADFANAYARATASFIENQEERIVEACEKYLVDPRTVQTEHDSRVDNGHVHAFRVYIDTLKWAAQRQGRRYDVKGDTKEDRAEQKDVIVKLNFKEEK